MARRAASPSESPASAALRTLRQVRLLVTCIADFDNATPRRANRRSTPTQRGAVLNMRDSLDQPPQKRFVEMNLGHCGLALRR
ncbi:MAG: hypothetical protein WDN02_13845 [Methylovirgula sp.]|uniref:hypothetical protein n=1 Tax=Methylovirgula sp. TaxID=1978224 RepID=UPI0030767E63